MPDAYFATRNGTWFEPTGYTRGPWDVDACHAGPPTALAVRALERIDTHQRLARIVVDLLRPIPMAGFRVQAEIDRPGRSVTHSRAEVFDDDRVYMRIRAMHMRTLDTFPSYRSQVDTPRLEDAVAGPFPVRGTRHGEQAFIDSVESRYDPSGSLGEGGATTMWMRTKVPILADEAPSGFQRICPLADSGNGISFNATLDEVLFVNTDLLVSINRDPLGEWLCSRVVSQWEPDGTGLADAALFDTDGPVGRATQTLLLEPA